jgi:inorganic pyrophosphatase
MKSPYDKLKPFVSKNLINVVVETPRGSRNKYDYDAKNKVFALHSVLPMGMSFPFDFGFVPGTKADDGDPVDVLLLLSEPAVFGCVVCARPIGVVHIQEGKEHNDRIIAVWPKDQVYGNCKEYHDIDRHARHDIDHFFRTYPAEEGRKVKLLGDGEAAAAYALIKKSLDDRATSGG